MNSGQKEIIRFWIFAALLLMFILIADSAGIGYKRKNMKISVIMDCSDSTIHDELEKGISEEASIQNLDINIEFLPKAYDTDLQKEIIKREIDNGAEALIIVPTDDREIKEWIRDEKFTLPITYIYNDRLDRRNAFSAGFDREKAGKILAENIAVDNADARLVMICRHSDSSEILKIIDTIKEYLPDNRLIVEEYYIQPVIATKLKKIAEDRKKTVVITDGPEATESVVKFSNYYKDWDLGIYSIGSDKMLLKNIEDGLVSGAVEWSDYAIGVRSVKTLMNYSRGFFSAYDIVEDPYFINSENIFDSRVIRKDI
ncbi:substrate-binding domain-containing protein [Lachnospiraceae bacterium C1.1]|nr:substrate-binding domain-containing protein [Lachnospiraceae bacterium C1.1]